MIVRVVPISITGVCCCVVACVCTQLNAQSGIQSPSTTQAADAMRRAAIYYRDNVSAHGGYVYHYSVDLSQRWGEGVATRDQIWVQPPGTPTVGMAFLDAYRATREKKYLDYASEAAMALVYGQLRSGGWTNLIDFDPSSKRTADYRRGNGRGKNNSSLDDDQTQSAIRFLIHFDAVTRGKHHEIHEASMIALNALLLAQFPNGGFPQVWVGPVSPQKIVAANYPDLDWRTEGRIKNYWDMYTLNDNVTGYVADVLIDAHETYHDQRYAKSLRALGDFLILSQMPSPQPGWAQQYNYDMQPIWARKFEPPGVSGDETQEVIQTLMKIAAATKDRKYLEPIPRAIQWLQRSLLKDGRLARYYELKTNRPLYMQRRGKEYRLTYDDRNLPRHYGWKTESRIDELKEQFARARRGKPTIDPPTSQQLAKRATTAIQSLDPDGRWISQFDGSRMVGQLKLPPGTPYLSSQVFHDRIGDLSAFIVETN